MVRTKKAVAVEGSWGASGIWGAGRSLREPLVGLLGVQRDPHWLGRSVRARQGVIAEHLTGTGQSGQAGPLMEARSSGLPVVLESTPE